MGRIDSSVSPPPPLRLIHLSLAGLCGALRNGSLCQSSWKERAETIACKAGSGACHCSSEASSLGQQLLGALELLGHDCAVAAAASRAAHIFTGSLCMGCYSELSDFRISDHPEASGQAMVYALCCAVPHIFGEFSLGPHNGLGIHFEAYFSPLIPPYSFSRFL